MNNIDAAIDNALKTAVDDESFVSAILTQLKEVKDCKLTEDDSPEKNIILELLVGNDSGDEIHPIRIGLTDETLFNIYQNNASIPDEIGSDKELSEDQRTKEDDVALPVAKIKSKRKNRNRKM